MNLRVVDFTKREPSAAVVERLRELLAMAERGEIVSFAAVAVMPDGRTLECWIKTEVPRLAGILSSLQYRIAAWMNGAG